MKRFIFKTVKIFFYFSTGFFVVYGLYRLFIRAKRAPQLLLPEPKPVPKLLPAPRIKYLRPLNLYLDETLIRRVRLAGQFLGIIVLTGFLGYILLNNLAPFGITVQYASENDHENISDIQPKERVKKEIQNGNTLFNLLYDIVYFTTKMPFHFDSAKVRVTFKNPDPDQAISLGFQDQEAYHYNTKPFDVPFLSSLSWKKTGTNPVLYQREERFKSVKDFLANPPKNALIGTYQYDTDIGNISQTQLPNYKPQSKLTTIDTPLRGSQIMYVYLKNEPFVLKIQKQDLNWYKNPDPMIVKVYKNDDLVFQKKAEDDGITDDSRKVLPPQEVTIENSGPGLPENGIYKIVIEANSDTLIKSITTNLHKIVFQDSLFLAGNSAVYHPIISRTTPTILYTNALSLSAQTYHTEGLQNISIGNQQLQLKNLNVSQTIKPPDEITKVVVPQNDVVLDGFQGFFAFDQNQFFLPTQYHIMPIQNAEDVGLVDYILTNYMPSQKTGDWQVANVTFDMSNAYVKNGDLSWIIQAPGLKDNNHKVIIKDIDITFYKKPWI